MPSGLEGSLNLTGSGVIGTPQYMSPEQGQGLKIDGRSDEYSLAVMAYEMIIGRPPFEAETPLAIVLKHITEPLTPPISINPRVPQAVSDVISKALSKDPNDRYPTTAAFAQALSAVIAAAPIGGTLPLPSAAPTEAVHITRHEPAQSVAPLSPDRNHRRAAGAVDDRHWRTADPVRRIDLHPIGPRPRSGWVRT